MASNRVIYKSKVKNVVGYISLLMSGAIKDPRMVEKDLSLLLVIVGTGHLDSQFCRIDEEVVTRAVGLTVDEMEAGIDRLVALGYLRRAGYAARGANPQVHFQISNQKKEAA